MRVLWLCNIVLPELCEEFGFKKTNVGGWLTGMWNEIKKQPELQLGICVPIFNVDRMKDGVVNRYNYYSFQFINDEKLLEQQSNRFLEIIEEFQPDVIHIWGTEYIHSYAMFLAGEKKGISEKIVVNIQGLVSVCVLHYENSLPEVIKEEKSIQDEIEDFYKRSVLEQKCLQKAKNIIGRTSWDRACVEQISPNVNYFLCNEILRETFYKNVGSWNYEKCEPYTIFISQASYPIKGFHIFLKALVIIQKQYPKVKVYVAGSNLIESNTAYAVYIRSEIRKYELGNKIEFLGMISEQSMCEYYKKCNVFVSASVIENSSNSVCEAAMIGIPIVASFVGGISNLISHEEQGYLYPSDEFYMMAYYVCKLFENKNEICQKISKKSVKKMQEVNNVEVNSGVTIAIYKELITKSSYNK